MISPQCPNKKKCKSIKPRYVVNNRLLFHVSWFLKVIPPSSEKNTAQKGFLMSDTCCGHPASASERVEAQALSFCKVL